MTDLLTFVTEPQKTLHSHGFVELVDVMPRMGDPEIRCDAAIVQAARVSYGAGTKTISNDKALIEYLLRNSHTSPFEMVEFKFHVKMPLFIARQWIRHRTASLNEVSARYSLVQDEFYIPEEVGLQSKTNKQCTDYLTSSDLKNDTQAIFAAEVETAYKAYEKLIEDGVSREIARMILPVNMYTEFYWKMDLHNLFHFLKCRMHEHAQKEIRDYSHIMFDMIKGVCPISTAAFEKYILNSIQLSQYEVQALRVKLEERDSESEEKAVQLPGLSKTETREFNGKLEKLGL